MIILSDIKFRHVFVLYMAHYVYYKNVNLEYYSLYSRIILSFMMPPKMPHPVECIDTHSCL
jgi:hypothetical protein